jgi:DNA-binding NarL/FixJ family response regulator
MQKIKIMIASRPKMISDIIRNIIEHQLDMTIVGEVVDPISLLYTIREKSIDVVIMTPIKVNGEPKICSHLLANFPSLIIVALADNNETAYLYRTGAPKLCIEDPSGQSLIIAIREVLLSIKG